MELAPAAASADGDLEQALRSLDLGHLLPQFHAPLGVHRLTEVLELEVEDLAEIGLTRLQTRRLLRAAGAPHRSGPGVPSPAPTCAAWDPRPAPGPWDPRPLNDRPPLCRRARAASPSERFGRPRRRSSSPCPIGRRSGSVSFRSASSIAGMDFEQRCRSEILGWLQGYGEEVCPKALGIQQHDCDLVVRLSRALFAAQVLPRSFHQVRSSGSLRCEEGALLFFEMKARARKVDHAVLQLRKRQELLRFRPATPCQVQLFAILALVPSDDQGYQLLRDAAWKHGDVQIATVDPDCLPKHAASGKPDLDWEGDDTVEALKWDDLDWEGDDTVEALKWDVCQALAHGPVHLVTLASGLGFAKRYNRLFHEGRRVNNGSWTAFLRSIPGVEVEESASGGYKPDSNVWLTRPTALGYHNGRRIRHSAGQAEDWHRWQPHQTAGVRRSRDMQLDDTLDWGFV